VLHGSAITLFVSTTIILINGYGFKSWKQPLAEMQGKTVYIRPKVVGCFPGPYVNGSYVYRAAPLYLSMATARFFYIDVRC
jgi:hypothetical protein